MIGVVAPGRSGRRQIATHNGIQQQRDAAARQDAFLDGRAGGMESIVDAVLLFLDLDFGGTAHAITEPSYGRFERRIALGFEAEDDKVSASCKNGVRTVHPAWGGRPGAVFRSVRPAPPRRWRARR